MDGNKYERYKNKVIGGGILVTLVKWVGECRKDTARSGTYLQNRKSG